MRQVNTESDLSEIQPLLCAMGKKRPKHQLVCDIRAGVRGMGPGPELAAAWPSLSSPHAGRSK